MTIKDYNGANGVSSKFKPSKDIITPHDIHVIQLDIDELDAKPRESGIFEALPDGFYLVFKTRENAYNITSLTIYDRQQMFKAMANVGVEDADHFKISYNRGHSILRLSGKGDRTRPELVDTVMNCRPEELPPLSMPHAELYAKLYHRDGLRSLYPAGNYIDGSINLEQYVTRVE